MEDHGDGDSRSVEGVGCSGEELPGLRIGGPGSGSMHGGGRVNLLKRKRGKHGPESRIAPMEESAISQAIRTATSRPGELVFRPAVGMEFNSAKEAKDFYNLYSWEIGFGIRTGRGRVNDNKYTTRQDFVCSCEGVCPNSGAATCRTGCKAMIRLHRTSDHGWFISQFETQHNHACSGTYRQNKQWPSHCDIDPMTKDLVYKLCENNIPIGRVCSILGVHGCESSIPVRKEAVRSLCARIAQDNIKDDIGKTMNLLEQMKKSDVGMEIRFKLDEDGKIKSMLWCSGKNRADYAKFGDVVTFDTTYRTNLYNLPFGLFVGVNNHFRSIVFGGVLLTTEKVEDFEWAFSKFAEIMGGKVPYTILTDQCQAMVVAIKSIFPAANHRWCRWHVLRKTKQKVGPVYSKKSSFKKEFNKLVTKETMVNRFERRWRQLMRKHNLVENEFMKRIFKHRAKWAKPYFMGIFCAGMTSTQRSESANHMLKQFIQRSAPMHMFVRKFNEFQMDRNDQEEKEVHLTKQMRRKRCVGVPIERHAELIYTRRISEKFYNELYYFGAYAIKSKTSDGLFEVTHSAYDGNVDQVFYKVVYAAGDKISCECGFYEHVGLLCRHALKVLVHLDVKEIPKNNIMPRWVKNCSESDEHSKVNYGLESIPGCSDIIKKRAIVDRVLEVAYGPEPISEELYSKVMGVMDLVKTQSYTVQQSGGAVPISSSTSGAATVHIRCPDRPTKKGRSCNSSLQSWKEEQKRKNGQSTDEENPRGGKTRLIADVLACYYPVPKKNDVFDF